MKITVQTFAAVAALGLVTAPALAQTKEVNVYTYREPDLIKPLFDRFTAASGIEVKVLFAKDGLEDRIATEGANSPADLLLTVDIARLKKAVDLGVAQPLKTPELEAAIPANLRDPDGLWNGISARARVFYASKERVAANALTYEDLAKPEWKGKVCIRSGQHQYNLGLLGAIIAHDGADKAKAWVEGVKANLAKKPSGGDRDVAKDIAAGACDIGVGNTYYVGLMQKDEKQKPWAEAIKVIIPTFTNGGGTHVNVSGIVLAKNAPNKDNAIALANWLVSDEAQKIYADMNYEYPVKPGVEASDVVKALGPIKPDTLGLADIANQRKAASELVDQVGFDN